MHRKTTALTALLIARLACAAAGGEIRAPESAPRPEPAFSPLAPRLIAPAMPSPSVSGNEAAAVRMAFDQGAVLDAYQDGTLARAGVSAPLAAGLEHVAQTVIKRRLEQASFKISQEYGLFATKILASADLPGVVVKTYTEPLARLIGRSRARRGYELAKRSLGGLFADTAIVEDVTVSVDGKLRRLPWALVQERLDTEATMAARQSGPRLWEKIRERGVKDTDLDGVGIHVRTSNGAIMGMGMERLMSLNVGRVKDGRYVHYDADRFKDKRDGTEARRRVPDPEPLRGEIRAAQAVYLDLALDPHRR